MLRSCLLLALIVFMVESEAKQLSDDSVGLHRASVSPCSASTQGLAALSPACNAGLVCDCLALNRGLHVCLNQSALRVPAWAEKLERQGLSCEPKLPQGALPMVAPPLINSDGHILDPRHSSNQLLKDWAASAARGFYSQYILVSAPGDDLHGVPILAGPDVSAATVNRVAAAMRHLLLHATTTREPLTQLANAGVRMLIAGDDGDAWQRHPEVHRKFTTGLGGGAAWFPSTGIQASEPNNVLAEELLHTIQYVVMKPQDVCMYRKAYVQAVEKELYTTDGSGPEVDGEPVPTVQADEYLALAMQRWFGSPMAPGEYLVLGNNYEATGREHLRKSDFQAFCLLSRLFRSDDTWNPHSDREPWKRHPNRGMNLVQVAQDCKVTLDRLAVDCPQADVEWPQAAQPRRFH